MSPATPATTTGGMWKRGPAAALLSLPALLLVFVVVVLVSSSTMAVHARAVVHTSSSPSPSLTTTPPLTYDQLRGKPYTVSYDSRAVLINGERVLLQSGSIHYPRSTPAMWASLLNLTKASGLNTVQIYVFWDLHEQEQGVYDFATFNRNLPAFLQLVADAGLFAFLRIGPYVCAEWNWGAMPAWLYAQQVSVRSMDPRWLAAMSTFVRKIANLSEPFLARNGGPIIMAQIENEFGNVENVYPNSKEYIAWCADLALGLNLSIPWVMCQQRDAPLTVINSCNGFYCHGWIPWHTRAYPGQPHFWTENWDGWMQNWGEAKAFRPSEDVTYAVLYWFARGGAFQNYYMWHGGTTFGRKTGQFIATNYDYDAPLDEFGVPHPIKYAHMTEMHQVLNRYASVIVGNDVPEPITPCTGCEVYVYGTAASNGVAFLVNNGTTDSQNITLNNRVFQVPVWSVQVVDLATFDVVFRTDVVNATVATSMSASTSTLTPASTSSADTLHIHETTAETMETLSSITSSSSTVMSTVDGDIAYFREPVGLYDPSTAIDAQGPLEQLSTTVDVSDYLWYVTYITLDASQIAAGHITLTISNNTDFAYIFFNGVYVTVAEDVWDATDFTIPLVGTLLAGVPYALQILSATMGIVNYSNTFSLSQIACGLHGIVQLDGVDLTQQPWYHQVGLQGEALELYTPNGAWNAAWSTAQPVPVNVDFVWYHFTLKTGAIQPPTGGAPLPTFEVYTGGLGKGLIWMNGFGLGRFWDIPAPATCDPCTYIGGYNETACRYDCGQLSQDSLHVPIDVLKPEGADNTIVVFVELAGDPSTVALIQRN